MDEPLIWVRIVHFAAAISVTGALLFLTFIAEPAFRKLDWAAKIAAVVRSRLAWIEWSGLALVVLSGAAWLVLKAAEMGDMLQGHDLLGVLVRDVQYRNGSIRSTIEVSQKRGGPPVRHALSQLTAKALEKWIAHSGKKANDYLFPGRGIKSRRPMSPRQLNRLVKLWVIEAELDPDVYGVDSLRRTKALHILRSTGDLQTVRALLGHARIENTARFLGLETKSDPIEVSRSFDI